MVLSKRLQTIADAVATCERVVDVGCDHGLLDIYLIKSNICHTALAIDINDGALNQARQNIKKTKLDNKIMLVKNDGLNEINLNENDTVIIAGLGAKKIKQILISKIGVISSLIVQSNNEIVNLRHWIISKGFFVKQEIFIIDNGKPTIVISFMKGNKKYSFIDKKYGPYLKKDVNYWYYLISNLNSLYEKVPNKNLIKKINILFKIKKLKFIKYLILKK